MTTPRPLHRLFSLTWFDIFEDSPVRVEPELDTAIQQTLLDVAISIDEPLTPGRQLPDGFQKMRRYNAVTLKTYWEALNFWAIQELIQHFVSWRKKLSGNKKLLSLKEFRLYAVCVRLPRFLNRFPRPVTVRPGVYDYKVLGLTIRIIVIRELPPKPQNAMFHLFSAKTKAVRFGIKHYRNRTTRTSLLICSLLNRYLEDPKMSNKLKEFAQETIEDLLGNLPNEQRLRGVPTEERLKGVPTEERLKGVPTEERLKDVPTEERLKGVPTEERLKGVPTEELRKRLSPEQRLVGLSVDEVLQGLSPEALEALKRKLRANG